jgi:antitoxin MazE
MRKCIFIVDTNDTGVKMKTRIQKWGNSLALRIPKSFATEAGIEQNSSVELSLERGKLIIVSSQRPRFTLKQLLSQVGKDNLHQEIQTGPPVGKEVW